MGPIEKWHADIRYEKEAKAAAHKKATQPSFTPPPVVVSLGLVTEACVCALV